MGLKAQTERQAQFLLSLQLAAEQVEQTVLFLLRAEVVVVVEMVALLIVWLVLALLGKEIMAGLELTAAAVAAGQVLLGLHVLELQPELVALVYNGQLTLYTTQVVGAVVVMKRLAVQGAMGAVALVDNLQQTEQTEQLIKAAAVVALLLVLRREQAAAEL